MARDFFPFVEEEAKKPHNSLAEDGVVSYPARIAIYDDPAVTPRVVVLEPTNIRDFLSSLTETVTKLSHEQGGTIPFTIIREIVENYIHAAFIEPTITILDNGNTIRFCDQGPGIKEKDKALQFGTTSATDSMKHYIRGVGSGLPIAQQYMMDKGGSLSIQDNISSGTIVTISTRPAGEESLPIAPRVSCQPASTPNLPGVIQNQVPTAVATGAGVFVQATSDPTKTATATTTETSSTNISLSARGEQILTLFLSKSEVGGKELAECFGGSQPTWSRELKLLDTLGLTHKTGQKRQLTALGKAYIHSLIKQ